MLVAHPLSPLDRLYIVLGGRGDVYEIAGGPIIIQRERQRLPAITGKLQTRPEDCNAGGVPVDKIAVAHRPYFAGTEQAGRWNRSTQCSLQQSDVRVRLRKKISAATIARKDKGSIGLAIEALR